MLSSRYFRLVHGFNLVYNTCWEDPRIDRLALSIDADDDILVITSAGCNVLDYLLAGANHVYAVDINHRQNALLELKLAAIRELDFETFFEMFGRGSLPDYQQVYPRKLRSALGPFARSFWDRNIRCFSGSGWRNSFYFHGSTGLFARVVNDYVDRVPGLRQGIDRLLATSSATDQHQLYEHLRPLFWKPLVRWMLRRDFTMALLGVPQAQRAQVEHSYRGGIAKFCEDCVEAVFARLPLGDNYFWRVYLTGSYSEFCCPEYLREDNFNALRNGLVDRISVHTNSIAGFLRQGERQISRFVLLDHMDWLAQSAQEELRLEWQAILDRALPHARILWRSGGLEVRYVNPLRIRVGKSEAQLGELLRYDLKRAGALHQRDRVHTYGSFYIADLAL